MESYTGVLYATRRVGLRVQKCEWLIEDVLPYRSQVNMRFVLHRVFLGQTIEGRAPLIELVVTIPAQW
jgi:hypothetical protein